eukprot:g1727.t1
MGSAQSGVANEAVRTKRLDEADVKFLPERCTVEMIYEMEKRWRRNTKMQFGLLRFDSKSGFSIQKIMEPLASQKLLDFVWSCFLRGPDGPEARVDALGLLSAYYVFCKGQVRDKALKIFNLFDFNQNEKISKDELTILLIATCYGILGYLGKIEEKNSRKMHSFEEKCERIASDGFVFKSVDDPSSDEMSINVEQFFHFITATLDSNNDGLNADDIVRFFENSGLEVKDRNTAAAEYDEIPNGPSSSDDSEIEEDDGAFAGGQSDSDEGDETLAIRPWLGAVKVPTKIPKIPENMPPERSLDLDWCYGYRSFDVRNNVRYVKTGEVVFHSAAVVVLYDKKKHTQRFLLGHEDDVVSLAVSPDGERVVTGEIGKRPRVIVWDAFSGTSIATFRCRSLRRAVTSVAFSYDGSTLAVVGQDDRRTLHVIDIETNECVAKAVTTREKVLSCNFLGVGNDAIMVCGAKFVKIFRIERKRKRCHVQAQKVFFGKRGPQVVLSSVRFGRLAVASTLRGDLLVWNVDAKGEKVSKKTARVVTVEKDVPLYALWATGDRLFVGGKSGTIWIFSDRVANAIRKIEVASMEHFTSALPSIRSVCVANDRLLVGTQGGEIIEVCVGPSDDASRAVVLQESHFHGEVWGLSLHPKTQHACTAGDDKFVRLWDLETHRCVARTKLNAFVRALAYAPRGKKIACGTGGRLHGREQASGGHVLVLDAASLKPLYAMKDAKKWIRVLRFSPDGRWLWDTVD